MHSSHGCSALNRRAPCPCTAVCVFVLHKHSPTHPRTPAAGIKLDKEVQKALDKEVGLMKVRTCFLFRRLV